MAGYQPPVGLVELVIKHGYEPPIGLVELVLGPSSLDTDRTLTVSGRIGLGITGTARIQQTVRLAASGMIGRGITGAAHLSYNLNLLSPIHAVTSDRWKPANLLHGAVQSSWQEAMPLRVETAEHWEPATPLQSGLQSGWRNAPRLDSIGGDRWRPAVRLSSVSGDRWRNAPRLMTGFTEMWRLAGSLSAVMRDAWIMTLPRLDTLLTERWRLADPLSIKLTERFSPGRLLIISQIERWRQAGYPANVGRGGPPIDPSGGYQPPVGLVELVICSDYRPPVGYVEIILGPHRCYNAGWIIIPRQRTYAVFNTATLVRLPDLTPLPCTSITVETDVSSWCWALTATLKTPDAWPLVQPDPLACEVRATINGLVWDFLLDVPIQNRTFNSDSVSLKGRSRSAWLHDPYTPTRDMSQSNARDINQLAEAALENTGWTLDWQIPTWLVPGGLWVGSYTPIGALLRLVQATGDSIYTDPAQKIISVLKRWPEKSWLLGGVVADVLIPEAALRSLSQSPLYTAPYNGVYVSGTSYGKMALIKIAGTDGALQPNEPVIDDLLCDSAGVAATQRGINVLSEAGAGFELQAETLLLPEMGLIRPGMVVSAAGIKGVVRWTRINAEWSGDEGLQVFNTLRYERREVEA